MADLIKLNVGGHLYTTTTATLTNFPKSMLGAMFSGRLETKTDDQGRYWIDANGEIFRYVLDFLRRNRLSLPNDFKDFDLLEAEAEYYQIQELIQAVQDRRKGASNAEYIGIVSSFLEGHRVGMRIVGGSDTLEQLKQHIPHCSLDWKGLDVEDFEKDLSSFDGEVIEIVQGHATVIQILLNMDFRFHDATPGYETDDYRKHMWFIRDRFETQDM